MQRTPCPAGPSQPLRSSLSAGPLYPGGSYRLAGRATLSPVAFSFLSLVPFQSPRFSKEVSAARPCHPVCHQAIRGRDSNLPSSSLAAGPLVPLLLSASANRTPSWEDELNHRP